MDEKACKRLHDENLFCVVVNFDFCYISRWNGRWKKRRKEILF